MGADALVAIVARFTDFPYETETDSLAESRQFSERISEMAV